MSSGHTLGHVTNTEKFVIFGKNMILKKECIAMLASIETRLKRLN